MPRPVRTVVAAFATASTLGVVACGGGTTGHGTATKTVDASLVSGRAGGTLTSLWSGDVDSIDCGSAYSNGVKVCLATQRALYGYKPNDSVHMVPDLATGPPVVSSDGRTVTVRIRKGVRFSPPVNREVTSKDVKYAVERAFFSTVPNPYAAAYFGDIVGAKAGAKPGTMLDEGITTPDDQTIVFHLSKGSGGVLAAGALGMELTAPVPQEYAAKFDRQNPNSYGEHQVATGPYMIEQDSSGRATGYEPGKRINLVRNPNWDRSTDFKPAYLDDIEILEGNQDATLASRRVLAGRSMVNGDWTPPPPILEKATTNYKNQLLIVPGSTVRYLALNTKIKPFDNLNVRRAVIAGFDRNALRLARGGQLVGDIATHFLVPGVAGFDQAGGVKGPGLDFLNATGKPNMKLAGEYMKRAGYPSGRYTGNANLLEVGSNEGSEPNEAQIAKANLEKLGFRVTLRILSKSTMYTKFCGVPAAKVAVCPITYGKDFADGQSMLDPTFNGESISPQGSLNFSQLDVPSVNRAIDRAKLLTDPEARATAWADVDKLVTAQAPAVPWLWDKWPLIESKNVNGVANQVTGAWDFAWTSLK
ncbi:MAG TPA: ABC transporter substrate-binding protein [Solirubrobacteraceae bacterium]|nr:ABC transporter substrate-binding protein [Solirubrobacteraceae bacterium]